MIEMSVYTKAMYSLELSLSFLSEIRKGFNVLSWDFLDEVLSVIVLVHLSSRVYTVEYLDRKQPEKTQKCSIEKIDIENVRGRLSHTILRRQI